MAEIEHFVDPLDKSHHKFFMVEDMMLPLFTADNQEKNGPIIRTSCTDWSAEIENSKNWGDNLSITLNTKEFNLFLIEKVFPK